VFFTLHSRIPFQISCVLPIARRVPSLFLLLVFDSVAASLVSWTFGSLVSCFFAGLIFPIQQQIELSVDWPQQDFIFSYIWITA
jgi:hypothetical protein